MVKKEASHFCHGKHLHARDCCKGLAFPISFPIGAAPLVLPRGLFLRSNKKGHGYGVVDM